MNINGLYPNTIATPTSNVGSVAGPAKTPSIPAAAVGGAATASISTPGQLFSGLQQLSQQNPTQFKTVSAQLATNFQNAAQTTSGPQAQFLNSLAAQFGQAAQTGQLAAPQAAAGAGSAAGGAGGHHHHHHGHGMSTGGSSDAVDQAFQSAMNILQQVQGASGASGASTSTA
jgi:hypothetical protein